MRDIMERIRVTPGCDPVAGCVRWDPVKSLWWSAMTAGWIVGGALRFSWGAVGAFLVACAVVLCGGHSLGMHRRLIHESFDCPHWLTLAGAWLGTLVGLGGPRTMMHTHDLRDWAQRQPDCHPYLRHGHGPWRDFWWQVHGRLVLDSPPSFRPSALYRDSRALQFLQAGAFAQQLPVAAALFLIGGPGWVAWAVCGRVSLGIFGHWAVGWVAHNPTPQRWQSGRFHNAGHCTQGRNVRGFGLITFGEAYHNNHHAFPESARLGLLPGQPDPGWWVLCALRRMGLVWNVNEARPTPM
ncbi:acyl-CoA desaturase [uncultured Algimonas sp.]|uniref:fatty acid desaturase n=1 Tax=uncultured Algimonas sp. TaxID=1547920 RepID=UPI00261794BC|nr:acyl-CoA desaturase [uncultured Algimonas sp.]